MMSMRKKFITQDAKLESSVWEYKSQKETGSVTGGLFTGFYTCNDRMALIKQDPVMAHNIAEFLAGKIYQKIIPQYSAKIFLTRVDDSILVSEKGDNVYVVSEFIPGYQHDLYTEVALLKKHAVKRSSYKTIEILQIFYQQVVHLKSVFNKATLEGHFANFGEVSGTNLIINHNDAHVANLLVLKNEGANKKLGVIDYGYAWRNMTTKIHPHSFSKYLWTHARRVEGFNNFVFYPRAAKMTPSFVEGLDFAASVDLTDTIHAAFAELFEFYGVKPLLQFMRKTNLMSQEEAECGKKYDRDYLFTQLKNIIDARVKKRQIDLQRFSAQIKMDLCLKRQSLHQYCLTGYKDAKTATWLSFEEVIFKHADYFAEIVSGKEKFKLRDPAHQNRACYQLIKKEVVIVLASILFTQKQICQKFKIHTLDRAIEVINTGELRGSTLYHALQGTPEDIFVAKDLLQNSFGSLVIMAKNNHLHNANIGYIIELLKLGSNPEMNLPDGSQLIEHAKDASVRLLFVQYGAKLPLSLLPNVTVEEYQGLVEERKKFLARTRAPFVVERFYCFSYTLFGQFKESATKPGPLTHQPSLC